MQLLERGYLMIKKRGSEDHYKTVEDAIEYTRKRKIGELRGIKKDIMLICLMKITMI